MDISRENTDTVDSLIMMQTQNCYECIESIGCYECRYSFACIQCNHLYACTDLQGCSFCINCRNLRNQSYCIHNQKVSPETFQTYLKDHLNEVQHYNLADYKMNMFLNNCEHCF
ncbi:MAG: hypothetical protein LBG52_01210 [Candidatus Peribacteria bacterium]|nr:hypothetical protein [Candidatus Peribacteria bacterium]